MNGLAIAMRYSPAEGEALPSPFGRLSGLGAYHRRGQLSVAAGASGGGKSAYASHLAIHGEYEGGYSIPTLYFSADSDKLTLGTRAVASLLNRPTVEVEEKLRANDEGMWRSVESLDSIWWCWQPQLSTWDIEQEVEAYQYANGGNPHLIIVDNLINIEEFSGGGREDKDMVMGGLQRLAIETNAHVLVLHHVGKEFENGYEPIPKNALLDQVAKRPRLVLTFWKPGDGQLGISVVKNSTGKADSMGNYGLTIGWLPERSWMSE